MKPSKPYVVGLTGGIACGKTSVARALRDKGQTVLDADALSRELTAPGGAALADIRAQFGEAVFDGAHLNRRALGDLVFADQAARRRLEAILHPLIIARMQRETQAAGGLVFWDVPLLYETGMDAMCDEVWCVYAPFRVQARRLKRRDGLTRAQALARINSQMPLSVKKTRASRVINTSGDRRATRRRARGLLTDLQRRLNLE